jgi:hypothetical protein
MATPEHPASHEPWNKGNIVGQKAPFKLKDIWALRVRLQMAHRTRELAHRIREPVCSGLPGGSSGPRRGAGCRLACY